VTQSKAKSRAAIASGQKPRTLRVGASRAGQRIDNLLRRELRGVPKTRIYRMLRKGEVRVGGRRVRPEYRVAAGDELRLPPVRTAATRASSAPSRRLTAQLRAAVLYEDDQLLAMNKPAGLAVHGGSGVSLGLIEALRSLRPELAFLELVHRLDRDTSGCILLAKRRSSLRRLHAALRDGLLDKRYLALVAGRWPNGVRELRAPLKRVTAPSGERFVRVSAGARSALTRVRVARRLRRGTLLELEPVTGRTHQLRVHLAHAGFPVVGDLKYAGDGALEAHRGLGIHRLCLHAWRLELPGGEGPSGVEHRFEAPLPEGFRLALERLDGATEKW